MNDNTPQDMTAQNPEQEMQEQICAYLFGELDDAGREHVEARLAESATWRAEHDRLKGTIGLVETTLKSKAQGAQTALSAASMQTLQAAAQAGASGTSDLQAGAAAPVAGAPQAGGGEGTLHTFPGSQSSASPFRFLVPIAAGLAVTFGGMMAWKAMETNQGDPDMVANAEQATTLDSVVGYKDEESANTRLRSSVDGINETMSRVNESESGQASFGSEKWDFEAEVAMETSGAQSGKRPVYDIKHNAEVVVMREEVYDAEGSATPKSQPYSKVKKSLADIAKEMPDGADGFPDDGLPIRGENLSPSEQAKLLAEEIGVQLDESVAGLTVVTESHSVSLPKGTKAPEAKVLYVAPPQGDPATKPMHAPASGGAGGGYSGPTQGPSAPGPAAPGSAGPSTPGVGGPTTGGGTGPSTPAPRRGQGPSLGVPSSQPVPSGGVAPVKAPPVPAEAAPVEEQLGRKAGYPVDQDGEASPDEGPSAGFYLDDAADADLLERARRLRKKEDDGKAPRQQRPFRTPRRHRPVRNPRATRTAPARLHGSSRQGPLRANPAHVLAQAAGTPPGHVLPLLGRQTPSSTPPPTSRRPSPPTWTPRATPWRVATWSKTGCPPRRRSAPKSS